MTEHETYDSDDVEITTREKKPTAIKGLLFLGLMACVAVGLLFGASLLRSEEGPRVPDAEPDPISVVVVPAELAEAFALKETFTGLAEARRTSQLGFSTGGRIERMSADVGDRVARGRTLARLDTRGLTAQLAAAQATIEEARAAHALALSTVDRQRTLQAAGHVSQQRVDEAEAQANTSMARIEAAKAQADTLRVQIDLARITAPFGGVITARMADEGAIAAPGAPILELVETGTLEARIGVPASSVAKLTPGEAYTLQSDIGPVEATLRSVTGVIDAGQRTVTTIFEITANDALPVGAVVRLPVERQIDEAGFWVPVKALSSANRGLWSLYIVMPTDGGWKAEQRPVEMVHSDGERAFVRGPVNVGDRIVIDGLQRITNGMPVEPTTAASAQQTLSDG